MKGKYQRIGQSRQFRWNLENRIKDGKAKEQLRNSRWIY